MWQTPSATPWSKPQLHGPPPVHDGRWPSHGGPDPIRTRGVLAFARQPAIRAEFAALVARHGKRRTAKGAEPVAAAAAQ